MKRLVDFVNKLTLEQLLFLCRDLFHTRCLLYDYNEPEYKREDWDEGVVERPIVTGAPEQRGTAVSGYLIDPEMTARFTELWKDLSEEEKERIEEEIMGPARNIAAIISTPEPTAELEEMKEKTLRRLFEKPGIFREKLEEPEVQQRLRTKSSRTGLKNALKAAEEEIDKRPRPKIL